MKLAAYIEEFTQLATEWLAENFPEMSLADIQTGQDAWTVAHKSGITEAAYNIGRDVYDAHIQTVLEIIMTNAVFKDKKRY